jgi:hypothetical protein
LHTIENRILETGFAPLRIIWNALQITLPSLIFVNATLRTAAVLRKPQARADQLGSVVTAPYQLVQADDV